MENNKKDGYYEMKVSIVGAGKVGRTLAQELGHDGNDITIVDLSAEKVRSITERYDVMGVVGNGATPDVQREAGISAADLLIAVTGSDELNLLCCIIAKKEGNCQTIARLENPEYSNAAAYLKDELGLAMVINPQQAAAAEIVRVLRFPSAISIEPFARGKVELLKFKLPEKSPIAGLSVKEVAAKIGARVLFSTVERGSEVLIAKGDLVFEERDVISIIATPRAAADFFKKIDYKTLAVKDAMIVGGGELTHYLLDGLCRLGMSVKVIEKNRRICEELSQQFSDVTVINADPTDQEALIEEGVGTVGAFVALTEYDEENILLSLFAKKEGASKLVTKINRIDYDDLARQLDLDSKIYPKNITADVIVRYARAMRNTLGSNVETLYTVIKGKAEACEFKVRTDSVVVGIPLSTLKLREGLLIAAILRGNKVIIPRGADTIEKGDTVVVISAPLSLTDISDILSSEAK